MPQQYNPSGQDWDSVNVGRSSATAGGLKAVPKTAQELSLAKARGLVTTEKRIGAGGNQSAHSGSGVISARKLEEADDVGTIVKVDKSLSKAIMQARTAKKLTQKDLGTLINEKPQIVAEYESGKAIPNPAIITKLERALGVKLPRPGKAIKAPPKEGTSSTNTASKSTSGVTGKAAALTRGGPPKRR